MMNSDLNEVMPTMKKAWLMSVDANKPASAKQKYALGKHYAKIHCKAKGFKDSEVYKYTKRFSAIIHKYYEERPSTPLTHGDVTTFIESSEVPVKFEKLLVDAKPVKAVTKPKASKAAKAVKAVTKPKASKAVKPAAPAQPKVAAAKKPSEMDLSEFKAQFAAMDSRVSKAEKRIATMDAKLDIIMAYIQSNPDA